MKLSELEAVLPNGFHDAVLESITVDYGRSTVILFMYLWIGLLDPIKPLAGRDPVMRRASIRLTGLGYCCIDPPQRLVDSAGGINVSGEGSPDPTRIQLPMVEEGMFIYVFYACDWNSFIYVAARDAQLEWHESEESAWLRAREEGQ